LKHRAFRMALRTPQIITRLAAAARVTRGLQLMKRETMARNPTRNDTFEV
jgi:hypothetical protein